MRRLYTTMRKRSRRASMMRHPSMTFGIYYVTEAEQITSREVAERHNDKEMAA